MIWCRLPGASGLGHLSMVEHYQKRIEGSRYLNIAGWLGAALDQILFQKGGSKRLCAKTRYENSPLWESRYDSKTRGVTCLREAASAKAGGRFSEEYVCLIMDSLVTV